MLYLISVTSRFFLPNTLTMSESTPVVQMSRMVGRVKWFNNKSGFGFITVCEGDHKDKDIFVHYSSIRAESQQYKYLVQGEYIEFHLIKSDSENHEYHASDVSGIKEGILMCETHRLNNSFNTRQTQSSTRPTSRGGYYQDEGESQPRPSFHRSESANGEGFSEVKRRKKPSSASSSST